MGLKRRGGIWWVDVSVGGRRVRRSTGTASRARAQEYHDRLAERLWRGAKVGERPNRTWREAVVRFARETKHKRTHDRDLARLKILDPYIGHLDLAAVDRDVIDDTAAKLARDRNITPAAVNRYLALIRSILRRAEREWRWLDSAPAIRLAPEGDGIIRWLSRSEYARLMRALPDHLKGPAELTLQTGLRQANAFGLRWDQVDLRRRVAWIDAGDAKAGKALRVPLNDKAAEVIRSHQGIHPTLVFNHRGKRVRLDGHTWARVLRDAEIEDFRWHDLRHTWASWHVMNGTSLQELMQLAGWSTYAMALRYAHLAPGHLDHVAGNVAPPDDSPVMGVPESASHSGHSNGTSEAQS